MRIAMIAAALAVALHGHGRADDQTDEAIQKAANNVSAEMSVCAAFNQVMAACFLRSNFNATRLPAQRNRHFPVSCRARQASVMIYPML